MPDETQSICETGGDSDGMGAYSLLTVGISIASCSEVGHYITPTKTALLCELMQTAETEITELSWVPFAKITRAADM